MVPVLYNMTDSTSCAKAHSFAFGYCLAFLREDGGVVDSLMMDGKDGVLFGQVTNASG